MPAFVSERLQNPRPRSPRATNQLLITTMSVSFYHLGATPRLLSNGIRKFQRRVSRKQYIYCITLSSLIHHFIALLLMQLTNLYTSLSVFFVEQLNTYCLYVYRNYSQSWSISGCVQKADCDSPGYDNQATCCAAQYGGQTGGACSTAGSATANPNNGKFYADYSTPWFTAGCKNTLPHPPSATIFYTTQLQCCKAAFGGQTSNACVMGLPSPPTAKPSVALTTIAPITKSPTTEAGQGGGWYADYGTPWPNAGCKNTIPLPVYATMFYTTQLACCKAAFGGQYSGACIKGLPNPPTSKPTITTAANQSNSWYADYGTPWLTGGCKNTLPLPNHAIIIYSSQLKCCKGAYGGQMSNACIKGLPNPPTKSPVLKPSFRPSQITDIIVYPTAGQSISPTISNPTPSFIPTTTSTSTQSPSARPNTSPSTSPSKLSLTPIPTERPSVTQLLTTSTTTPTASPSQSPTNLAGDSISSPSPSQLPSTLTLTAIPSKPESSTHCKPNIKPNNKPKSISHGNPNSKPESISHCNPNSKPKSISY